MEKVFALLDVRPTPATAVTLITLATSFAIAEPLYKFHSFTLETGAFLATWWALRRIGLLQIELLRAGAARAINVELSGGYELSARDLLAEAGLAERVERRIADFVADAERLPTADAV